jgi:hypothetical protein
LQEAVLRFASTGCKVRIADPHDLFLLAPDSVLLRSTDVDAATRMMGRLLIREVRGTLQGMYRCGKAVLKLSTCRLSM